MYEEEKREERDKCVKFLNVDYLKNIKRKKKCSKFAK